MDFIWAFLRRRYLSIAIGLVLCLPIGGLYLLTTSPTYTATATMIIEARSSQLQKSLLGEMTPDAGWIESQIGVIKSQNVAAYLVKQLHLADDPAFLRSDPGPFDKLLVRLGLGDSEPNSDAERTAAAMGAVSAGLNVRRIGQSYLLSIAYEYKNPELAAKIANSVIDAYVYEQLNSKYQANRRAGDWLQERLQALREQAAAAERAVVEFKAKNNIVAAGGGSLMNEKQLGDTSGQLAGARAHASDLEARLNRIEAVRKAYQQDQPTAGVDETISDALGNSIITGLRTKYLDYVNREADWSAKYGKDHAAVVNLRNQIRDIRRSIYDELGRIQESYRSDYEIAKQRQAELEKALAGLISQSTETNQAQVTLFSLEAAAKSYRKLYDNFLEQHTESVQQQSFPISDARAISLASASKTAPRPLRVWLVTILAGGMLGVGFGALRELRDRGFRTREQVRAVLDRECLALVPLIPEAKAKQLATSIRWRRGPRSISTVPKLLQSIIDAPTSEYAEAIRSLKLNVNFNTEFSSGRTLGLTSCLPNEGKSSVAVSMGTLLAQSGERVLVVDCDARHPSLSRALAPEARVGVLDCIAGKVNVGDVVWHDPATNMAFLPMVANPYLPSASELFVSQSAKSLFASLQHSFDYVIVDLPPLLSELDVRAMRDVVDGYILVVQWGATKIDAVQYALRHAPKVQEKIVGAVLNKVNMAALGRYDSYGARYYSSYYYRGPAKSRLVN
jgi:succinoglycan biosynthesis transport protein ExoP